MSLPSEEMICPLLPMLRFRCIEMETWVGPVGYDIVPLLCSSNDFNAFILCFVDLFDSIIVDVASECHRIVKLGLDRNFEEDEEELRLSAQAQVRVADPSNSGEANNKYVVDIFGQNHPSVAIEVFECMTCGRFILAGKFAPHLEKCMGKARKAHLKVTRSSMAA
ncbi:hypothetical protein ACFX2I_006654 [Malus domestica]